jgi:beta-glucosidase
LFDNLYVDGTDKVAGSSAFCQAGELAQRKSIVLLKDGRPGAGKTLPLQGSIKIYVEGIDPQVAAQYAQVVESIDQAELAILRLNTPYQPRHGGFLESMFHAGDLDFKDEAKASILRTLDQAPTIVAINLDRPAVIPEISQKCAGLLADFAPHYLFERLHGCRAESEDLPYDPELYPLALG